MKYLELTLSGYKRFSLNAINYFSIKPNEKFQLILGSNGSGKSSLLRELSPMPAQAADFSKDGFKTIKIEHRGHTYTLTSVFSPTQRHSFYKDDNENLNPGGTASVQKELVKREFNITQDIQDVLIGSTRFSAMGPGERRSWFTKLSDTSYVYAIGVYQKLKEKHRDITGAIKLNQARSVQEANKLLSSEQELHLREEVIDHNKLLNELLELKTPNQSTYNLTELVNKNDIELDTIARQIISLRSKFMNDESFTSLDDIDQSIFSHHVELESLKITINNQAKIIEDHQLMLDALSRSNLNSIQEINGRMIDINTEINSLSSKIRIPLTFDNPATVFQSILSVQDSLTDIFTDLAPNENKLYSRERFQEVQNKKQILEAKITNLETEQLKVAKQKQEQEHYKTHTPLECPKCKYSWHKGFEPILYDGCCKTLESLSKAHELLTTELKTVVESIETIQRYIALYQSYLAITRSWPSLQPLWSYLLDTSLIFNNPKKIISVIEDLKGDLKIGIQIQTLMEEKDSLEKLKALSQKDELANSEKLKLAIDSDNEKLYHQNARLRELNQTVIRLRNYKEIVQSLTLYENQLTHLIENRDKYGEELIAQLRRNAINTLIQTVQLELSKKEQQLSQVNVQKALVDNIQQQLTELIEENEVLKLMVKELSPTDGLIAKGMLGFINNFTKQMNSFIKKVWLYPLVVTAAMPEEGDEIDLDYKFPVNVNNNNTIADVKLGSSAMKEIIDLAFMLVSMKCMDLSDGVIGLDELGHSMDSAHRASVVNVITNLIGQSSFSQIFIISHYDSMHGSLLNSEITVMCPANITIPPNSVYNQHVVMK